ncbi:MAG: hypothetical protein GX437_07290 [Sphingobacteriales bacterium]|nr:hypothetical protein [Sphingobacteriales bacterium]
MKAKYLIIAILIVLLALTVRSMMKIEENIRSEKIKLVEVTDKSKPLFNPLPAEEIAGISQKSTYSFKADRDYFEVLKSDNQWEKIFFKGVNIGTAVPGKFPTEFSLSFEQYLEWFRLIGEMNANVIRVYTVLPPEFYRALAVHNQRYFSKKLYLFQGVWTELPAEGNFYNVEFVRNFQEEIIKVINLIHGKAVVAEKPGHASGVYQTDISQYVAGILLGREWEPDAVEKTNRLMKKTEFRGNFINVHQGNAMEVWLGEMMDFAIQYETQTFQTQRPVSFVNWLPLDPMFHSSEYIEAEYVREYDNDLKSLDFTHFHKTTNYLAGFFASYHVYPYYPDFICNEAKYSHPIKPDGKKDNFYFYLLDLKEHCKGIPLLISEYGLPSSRGNSHYTPLGFDQGGHSEMEQAVLSEVLTRDIYNTRCAGAVYFEWIDEWFKRNWLVMDFEEPAENRRLWHNLENPEQNYGIVACESIKKTIDANGKDWTELKTGKDIQVNFSADPAYFYILAQLPDFDFKKHNLYIAFDTYDKLKGEHKLRFLEDENEHGIEFLAEFQNTGNAELFVDDYYTVFTDRGEQIVPPYHSVNNNNGKFVSQWLLANRKRESVTGEKFPEIKHNRGKLTYGISSSPASSNADWYWDNSKKILELRFTWQMLNVTDPSIHAVLDNNPKTREMDYSITDGFHIQFFITDKNDQLVKKIPESGTYFYTWDSWIDPPYKMRLKPVYYSLKKEFARLKKVPQNTDSEPTDENFTLLPYPGDYQGAISLVFNVTEKSIREIVLPSLLTYDIQASFIISELPQSNEKNPLFNINRALAASIDSAGGDFIFKLPENQSENFVQALKTKMIAVDEWTGKKCTSVLLPDNFPFKSKPTDFQDIQIAMSQTDAYYRSHQNGFRLFKQTSDYQLIDSLLNAEKGWYNFYIDKIVKNPEMVRNQRTVTEEQLHRLIRLFRNNKYWITTPEKLLVYQNCYRQCTIKTKNFNNLIFVNCVVPDNAPDKYLPLAVKYRSKAKIIKVSGSASDGIYNLHSGEAMLFCFPGKEVTIEIMEP